MLADNIRKYRKAGGMSQDELAQQLNVTRQSVSLWENGQAQPTIDNIIALSRIYGISTDELLGNAVEAREEKIAEESLPEAMAPACEPAALDPDFGRPAKKPGGAVLIAVIAAIAVVLAAVLVFTRTGKGKADAADTVAADTAAAESTAAETPQAAESAAAEAAPAAESTAAESTAAEAGPEETTPAPETTAAEAVDLFEVCKNFSIEKGVLNGDYSMYMQASSLYGGYDNEYFSVSYWGDSDMVEFCLHCPLDDTQSENFYLRMRGGFDGTYEYCTSKYYRKDGTPIRNAVGTIDPSVFSDHYPLNCSSYVGDTDGQDSFMEESRVGMCDLIKCLRAFVDVEKPGCSYSDFGFVNF